MIDQFYIHIDSSGLPSSSISSIHMNRTQATRIIKRNIINNCRSHCGGPDTNYSVSPFIDNVSKMKGHQIPYYLANDISFIEFLRLSGAKYWFREFDRCMIKGRELEPTKDDGILLGSFVLVSILNDTDYCVLWDENFGSPSAATLKDNSRIINGLNDSHYMLDKLVDGYMMAQSHEKQIEAYYREKRKYAGIYLELLYQEYGWH